jgi:hypothetical protein
MTLLEYPLCIHNDSIKHQCESTNNYRFEFYNICFHFLKNHVICKITMIKKSSL